MYQKHTFLLQHDFKQFLNVLFMHRSQCIFQASAILYALMHIYSFRTMAISILYCRQQLVRHTWVHYLYTGNKHVYSVVVLQVGIIIIAKLKGNTKQARQLRAQQGKPFACAVIYMYFILSHCYVKWKQFVPFGAWDRSFCKLRNSAGINLQDTAWHMVMYVCRLGYGGYEQHPLFRAYQVIRTSKVWKSYVQNERKTVSKVYPGLFLNNCFIKQIILSKYSKWHLDIYYYRPQGSRCLQSLVLKTIPMKICAFKLQFHLSLNYKSTEIFFYKKKISSWKYTTNINM